MTLDCPRLSAGFLAGCLLWGLATPALADLNVQQVAPGFYTGTAPETAADYAQLRRLQVYTVVDMRKFRPLDSRREGRTITQHGMHYHHIPMGFFPTRTGTPELVLRLLTDPSHQPIYIHCQLGRDRTGLIAALYRVRCLGWTPEAAYAAMERQQFNPLLRDLDRYFWQNTR